MSHQFGGNWTQEKLHILEKYMHFYTTALKNQNFERQYIDAFAGTGSRDLKVSPNTQELLFEELNEKEPMAFVEGSARVALQTEPSFDSYIFVEQNPNYLHVLQRLKDEFPDKATKMKFQSGDANQFLQSLPSAGSPWWDKRRAVLFLDPYGMQVSWDSIKAIAATQAIDMWYLFPMTMGVIRLLRKDRDSIPENHRDRLNAIFGESSWYDKMYARKMQAGLFDDPEEFERTATVERIKLYIVERLRSVFPGVAANPLLLRNSRNSPLYLFCFAAANPSPKAYGLAIRVAEHILKSSQ